MPLFYKIVAYILTGLLGLSVGSFLNVVIYRVPEGLSLAFPASHCPRCKYKLRWYDNIPIISYLILGGRCRECRERISFRYTAVEILNTLLWLLSMYLFMEKSIPLAIISALTMSVFICIFFIDLEHKLIFDRFVIILLLLGTAIIFFDPYYDWHSHVVGGVVGFLSFYLIALVFFKIKGQEGLGGGDIKLTGAAGLLLGWQRLVLALLIAAVFASIILIILTRRDSRTTGDVARDGATDDDNGNESTDGIEESASKEYPFAPFLTVGFAFSLFFGYGIVNAYLSLLGL